jgi:hypothetical protein
MTARKENSYNTSWMFGVLNEMIYTKMIKIAHGT